MTQLNQAQAVNADQRLRLATKMSAARRGIVA